MELPKALLSGFDDGTSTESALLGTLSSVLLLSESGFEATTALSCPSFFRTSTGFGSDLSSFEESLLSFAPIIGSGPFSRLRFFLVVQVSCCVGDPAESKLGASPASSRRALSAASRCFLNASSCSAVSFLTAASFARVDSRTESRNSTSSSSSDRN